MNQDSREAIVNICNKRLQTNGAEHVIDWLKHLKSDVYFYAYEIEYLNSMIEKLENAPRVYVAENQSVLDAFCNLSFEHLNLPSTKLWELAGGKTVVDPNFKFTVDD